MATYQTPNLNLNTWAPIDNVDREEFNDNFDKIDAHATVVSAGFDALAKKTDGIINLREFNAVGDGVANDSAVFNTIESTFADKVVDLGGKTYLVNSLPTKNKYVNGRFLNNGAYLDASFANVMRMNHGVISAGLGAAAQAPTFPSYDGSNKFYKNIAIGGYAMKNAVGSYNNIAIGWDALSSALSGEKHNIAIGNEALLNTKLTDTSDSFNATRNVGIGINALRYNINGHHNLAIGRNSMQCTKNGSYNTALGVNAIGGVAPLDLTGKIIDYTKYDINNVTAVGNNALLNTVGDNNTAVGSYSAMNITKAKNNVSMGYNSLYNLQSDMTVDGKNKIAWSGSGTYVWSGKKITVTIPAHGLQNGYLVSLLLTSGANLKTVEENQYVISNVLNDTFEITAPIDNNTSGSVTSSWYSNNSANLKVSDNNTSIGNYSMENSLSGQNNTALGTWSGRNLVGDFNVMIGALSGINVSFGDKNTALGYGAMRYNQDGTNTVGASGSTAIGFDSRISGDNQIQLGTTGTTVYAYGAIQNRSDMRDKADVRDTQLGLDFIKKIRPVDFRWDYRDDYLVVNEETGEIIVNEHDGSKKRKRYHQGVIAQEVKAVMDETGADFGGFQDHKENGGSDVLTVGYEEFIAPLIKSVQELSAKFEAHVEASNAEIAALKAEIESLKPIAE